jgi:hypothetical protein
VNLFGLRALNLGKRLVKNVARVRQPQPIAVSDERACNDRQDVVTAVPAQNPIRINF